MHRVGVLVQEPTVGGLEEAVWAIIRDLEFIPTIEHLLVEVVLRTALGPAHASCVALEKVPSTPLKTQPMTKNTHNVHALLPAVVCSKGQDKVAAVGSECIREVLGTGPDIVTLGTSHKNQETFTP